MINPNHFRLNIIKIIKQTILWKVKTTNPKKVSLNKGKDKPTLFKNDITPFCEYISIPKWWNKMVKIGELTSFIHLRVFTKFLCTSITFLTNIKHNWKKIRPFSRIQKIMFHFIPHNNSQWMVGLFKLTPNKVMVQPNWSIKTLSRLFVLQSCCQIYITDFKPKYVRAIQIVLK